MAVSDDMRNEVHEKDELKMHSDINKAQLPTTITIANIRGGKRTEKKPTKI